MSTTSDPARDAACEGFLQQLFAINRMARLAGAEIHRRTGLHRTQIGLLGAIGRLGEVRLSDLACEQQVDPSVISRQITALEQAGLMTRRPDPADRRATLLSLTDDGRTALTRAVGVYRDAVAGWLQGWSTAEITQVTDALGRMTTAPETTGTGDA